MKKYTILLLLMLGFASIEAQAPYTFQKTNCRLEILSASAIRYSLLLEDVRWVDRSGGQQISIYDGVMTMTLRGNEITNYTGGQIDSLKLDLATWRLACLTRVSGDTLFIGSDTVIVGGSSTNNFAQANLTFDGNRTHALAGFDITIAGVGEMAIGSNPAGSDWPVDFVNNLTTLGPGTPGGGLHSANSVSAVAFDALILDASGLGLNDHTMFVGLAGDESDGSVIIFYDTANADITIMAVATGDDGSGKTGSGTAIFGATSESDSSTVLISNGGDLRTNMTFQNISTSANARLSTNTVGEGSATTGINNTANTEQGVIALVNWTKDTTEQGTIGYTNIWGTSVGDTFHIRGVFDPTATFNVRRRPLEISRGVETLFYFPNDKIQTGEIPTGATASSDGRVVYQAPHDNRTFTLTGDGTTTVDWLIDGGIALFQFGAFNETFTFVDPTFGGKYVIQLIQDGVGSRTATWPANVDWAAGSAPTLTTTATTGKDYIEFFYDGISTYNGVVITLDLR